MRIMKEQIITFETAKLAKEKGFIYYLWTDFKEVENFIKGGRANQVLPTQSLLQKWLREEHNIIVYVSQTTGHIGVEGYYVIISDKFSMKNYMKYDNYDEETYETKYYISWEEALEKGLQEALKLIEN